MVTESMPEKDFMQAVIEYARANGWLVYHTYDSRRSAPGFPDLVAVQQTYPHRVLFAECKSEKGKLTANQEVWFESLMAATAINDGVEAHIWKPSDWDVIQRTLG